MGNPSPPRMLVTCQNCLTSHLSEVGKPFICLVCGGREAIAHQEGGLLLALLLAKAQLVESRRLEAAFRFLRGQAEGMPPRESDIYRKFGITKYAMRTGISELKRMLSDMEAAQTHPPVAEDPRPIRPEKASQNRAEQGRVNRSPRR